MCLDMCIYIYIYVFIHTYHRFTYVIEASLEAKLPTISTDGKAPQPARRSEMGKIRDGEDQRWKKSEERRCRCAKR